MITLAKLGVWHRSLLVLLYAPLLSTSCKTTSSSDVKHEVGAITLRTQAFSCQPKKPEDKMEELHSYLTDHVRRIAGASVSVIPSQFGAEKFCLLIEDGPDINAFALDDGTIAVVSGLLKATENDAQFAAVVAHEMAHVLQGHGSERIPDEMQNNSDYKKLFDLMRQNREALLKLQKKYEQSVAANPEKAKQFGPNLTLYFSILDAYASALSQDPYTSWSQDLYKNIVLEPFPEGLKGSSANFSKRKSWPTPTLRGMSQDARQNVLSLKDQNLVEEFLQIEKTYLQDYSAVLLYAFKYSEADRRAKLVMSVSAGLERASNWREQEADEVGFELYLRAGYDYRQYIKMLENLERSVNEQTAARVQNNPRLTAAIRPNVKVESLADEIAGKSCQRGTATHPKPCWRMADIKLEWEKHKEFYANLSPSNPAIQVFGERLKKIRESLLSAPPPPTGEGTNSSNQSSPKNAGPQRDSQLGEWCDPYRPSTCFPYCKSLTSDPSLSGWGSEDGKTCVIKDGPIDMRQK
jgi:hypothetical protein